MTAASRTPLILVVALLALGASGAALPAAAKSPKAKAVPGELIVGFEAGVSDAERRQLLRRIGGGEKRRFNRIRGALVDGVAEPQGRGARRAPR